jgi:hypothetical protein
VGFEKPDFGGYLTIEGHLLSIGESGIAPYEYDVLCIVESILSPIWINWPSRSEPLTKKYQLI